MEHKQAQLISKIAEDKEKAQVLSKIFEHDQGENDLWLALSTRS
jgi:hypothetical protein